MGVKGQIAWNKYDLDMKKVIELYQNKMSVPQIAKLMGVSQNVIYVRLRERGVTRTSSETLKGKNAKINNPNWKGGRHVCKRTGYVILSNGEREHRLVAEQKIGRKLLKGEVVHHINGDTSDNRPENLEVLPSQSEHMKLHMTTNEARRRGLQTKRSKAALLAVIDL